MSEKGLLKIAKKLNFSDEQKQELEQRMVTISDNSVLRANREVSFKFAPIVRDGNKSHLFNSAAKKAGFQQTLDHGTHIAAHKEQYVLDILEVINAVNKIGDSEKKKKELVYINESIEEFKRPLYHGGKTNWHCEDVREINNDIGLEFSAINEKGKDIIPKSISKLGLERRVFTAQDRDSFSENSIIASREDEIESDELGLYYECLGRMPQGIVPMMFPASFPISLLLDVYSKETGKLEETYVGMDLEFHNQPNLSGKFTTRIIMPSKPEKKKRAYEYTFQTLCTQERTPILSGKIVCQSLKEIKLG